MFDISQQAFDEHGDYDEQKVTSYIEGLMAEFAASPEAKPFLDSGAGIDWPATMMEYALNYVGVTPAKMTPRDFGEVVFDLIPRKVCTEAENAPEIVDQLRAFWQFVERQHRLPNATQILATLNGSAVERLRDELANPSNFGMAKSLIMLGQQAGFDVTSREGLDEFMLAYNSELLAGHGPDSFLLPPDPIFPSLWGGGISAKERAAKRKARKRQRQARKRNRK